MRRESYLIVSMFLATVLVVVVMNPSTYNEPVVATSEASDPVLAHIATSTSTTTSTTLPPPPPTTTTTVPVATTAAPRPARVAAPAPVAWGDVWVRLSHCESGHRNVNTGNGYYGYFQFSASTWRSVGGTGLPHHHGWDEQLNRAKILQARSGWGQWPACSRKLGLR